MAEAPVELVSAALVSKLEAVVPLLEALVAVVTCGETFDCYGSRLEADKTPCLSLQEAATGSRTVSCCTQRCTRRLLLQLDSAGCLSS